jgi:hypothetical protein
MLAVLALLSLAALSHAQGQKIVDVDWAYSMPSKIALTVAPGTTVRFHFTDPSAFCFASGP